MDEVARSEAATADRRLLILVGVAALVGLGILSRPLWVGEIYTDTDLGNLYLPLRAFYADCLVAGHRFTWFPLQFTGFYLHGEGQLGLFHPLNLLQYRLLPLPLAFNLELLRSYALLLAGLFLLLRRWEIARAPALVGACLFAFSSFTLVHYMHLNVVGALAHCPWLLLALEGVLRPRSVSRGVLAALAVVLLTASQCLLGHPQLVWISALVELYYTLWRVWQARSASPTIWARFGSLAAAKLLGVAAAGIALLPVFESLAGSFRAAPPSGFISALAQTPLGLVQLVAPYLFANRVVGGNTTELALYLGAVPLVLLFWVFVRGRRLGAHWPLASATLILGGLALLLSLGNQGILYRLQSLLPVVGLFRAPARYGVIVVLAAAVLSAIAIADLSRAPGRSGSRQWLIWLPLLAGTAAAVLAPMLVPPEMLAAGAPLLPILAGPLLLGIATLLVLLAARGTPGALSALVLVALLDVGIYGFSFVGRTPPQSVESYLARFASTGNPGPDRLHWGVPVLTMNGIRLASGYAAMTPDRILDLGPFGARLYPDAKLRNALRVSTVRWAIGSTIPEPLPRARMVTRAAVSAAPNRDIGSIDVATTALVDEPVELDDGPAGWAEITVDEPGDIQILTNAQGRQLLVLAERYHEGWRAAIGGRDCRVIRAYGDYLACVVPAGRHKVRWKFEPTSLRHGTQLSAVALGLACAWTLLRLLQGKRSGKPP